MIECEGLCEREAEQNGARRCTVVLGATMPGRRWSCAVESMMRRHLDQVDQIRYHAVRLSGRRLAGRIRQRSAGAAAMLR